MLVRGLRIVAGATLVVMGAVAVCAILLPTVGGWTPYVVTSGSMRPTFNTGALVVAAPVSAEDVSAGDILTFNTPGGLTTHRVIEASTAINHGEPSYQFSTKGDANEDADPTPLDPRNIVGKAEFAVPHLGYLVEFVKAPLGAGLLAALFLFVVFSGSSDTKRKSERASSEDANREPVAIT